MNSCVKNAEVLADEVGNHPLTEAESARIANAAHRVLNQVEPGPRAGAPLTYQNA